MANVSDADMDVMYSKTQDDSRNADGQNDRQRSRSRSPRDDRRKRNDESRSNRNRGSGGDDALLKLLVPDVAGGGIIGKKGSNIQEMEEQSGGGHMKISTNGMFYPGTNRERILLLTGTVEQITKMNLLVMGKLEHERGVDKERSQTVKIIVPNATAGLVIGKGGADIKALKDETKAKIIVNSSDRSTVRGERLITVAGSSEAVEAACQEIISRVAADTQNVRNNAGLMYEDRESRQDGPPSHDTRDGRDGVSNLDAILGSSNQLRAMFGQQNQISAMGGLQQSTPSRSQESIGSSGFGGLDLTKIGGEVMRSVKKTATINIEIPDMIASAILTSGSNVLGEWRQFSGAEIDMSSRSDYTSRGSGRMLTIFGNLNQVQIAYVLVSQKIQQASNAY